MKPTGALIRDVNPTNQPENTWRDARNMVFSKLYSTATNEDGFNLLNDLGQDVCGVYPVIDGRFVIYSVGTYHEIGIMSARGTYKTILRDSRLNFDINATVNTVSEFSWNGDLIIAFIDDNNKPRILNVDTLPFEINQSTFELIDSSTFNLINIFNDIKEPIITNVREKSRGGALRTGTHFIAFSYELPDGNETIITDPSNPIYIVSSGAVVSADDYNGDPADTQTSKSLEFDVTNIDTRFSKIVIYVVSRIGGQITSKKISTSDITSSVMTLEYTGTEIFEEIPNEEILVERKSYLNAKAIATSGSSLFLGNVKGRARLDYQKYANNIKVKPVFSSTSLNKINQSHKYTDILFRGISFMPNEVYALYIGFNFKDGTKSEAFHIPGREASTGQTIFFATAINNNSYYGLLDELAEIGSITDVIYDGEFDRDVLLGSKYVFQTRNTATLNRMGYWHNSNEYYPDTEDFDIWTSQGKKGTLRGKPVRHHRFPDLTRYFHDTYNYNDIKDVTELDYAHNNKGKDALVKGAIFTNKSGEEANNQEMPTFGIRLEDIYIPDEIADQVESFEVYYAKRTIDNSLVYETGFVVPYNFYKPNGKVDNITGKDTNQIIAEGLVKDTFDIFANALLNNPIDNFANSPWRIYGFGLLNNKPSLFPTHVRVIGNSSVSKEDVTSDVNHALSRIDAHINSIFVPAVSSQNIIPLLEQEYAQANTISNKYNNSNRDEALLALHQRIAGGLSGIYGYSGDNLGDYPPYAMCYIESFKTNIYDSFTEQQLVSTGSRKVINNGGAYESDDIFNGDTFVFNYSHTTYAHPQPDEPTFSRERIFTLPVYSSANGGFRYEGETEEEKYALKTITREAARNNFYGYNNDYSFRNELIAVRVFNTNALVNSEIYPNRIIRTPIANSEDRTSSWRSFPSDLYFESARNKGEVTNLEGISDILFIHHKYTLYKTVSTDQLQTNLTEISIGTSDVFSVTPKDIISDDIGYLGNQNSIASFISKGKYFFVDADAGKVFLVDDQVREISNQGMRNWLRENLQFTCNKQLEEVGINYKFNTNAPTGYAGITAAFDPIYNRYILTKKDFKFKNIDNVFLIDGKLKIDTGNDPNKDVALADFNIDEHAERIDFTLSFSLEANNGNGGWVSFHDYKPNLLFSNRKNIFSLNEDSIYEHNFSKKKAVYYDNTKYESYIDFVINTNPNDSKVFISANWLLDARGGEKIDKIFAYNDTSATGILSINDNNTKLARNRYSFNDLKDRLVNPNLPVIDSFDYTVLEENIDYDRAWYEKGKMKGNYINIRLITSNSNQKDLYLENMDAKFRMSYL